MYNIKYTIFLILAFSLFFNTNAVASDDIRIVDEGSLMCGSKADMDRAYSALLRQDFDRIIMMVAGGRCFLSEKSFETFFVSEDGDLIQLELDLGVVAAEKFWTVTKAVRKAN